MTRKQQAYDNMVYAAGIAVGEMWAVERLLRTDPGTAAQRLRAAYTALRDAQNDCDRLWGR